MQRHLTLRHINVILLGALGLTLWVLAGTLYLTTSVVMPVVLGGIALALGTAAWALWKNITQPIDGIKAALKDIIDGDLNRNVPATDHRTDIGAIARTIDLFRDVAKRQQEVEHALAHANEELKTQIYAAEDLYLRTEAEATTMAAMADDLAIAKEEAERASRRAAAEEDRIRTILNTVTDAIITIDDTGIIETFNPAAEKMFERTASEATGLPLPALLASTERQGFMDSIAPGKAEQGTNTLLERVAKRSNGDHFPCEVTVNRMTISGTPGFTVVMRDITARKAALDEIKRMAMTDALTGLGNRNRFQRRLDEGLALARRGGHLLGLMLLDLDRFKPVNDTYGHPAGDKVLLHVASALKAVSRDTDTIARLGGDEFAVLIVHPKSTQSVHIPAQRIIDAISRPMNIEGHKIQIGASIGISFYPNNADNAETMIKRADQALYEAKATGRNTYRFFDDAETGKRTA